MGDIVLSDNAFKDKFTLIKGNNVHGADNLSAGEMKLVVTKEFSLCVANLRRVGGGVRRVRTNPL